MNIDWPNFTPWAAALGGIFIGLAAALFMLLNGRVLGVSSILGGVLKREPGDMGWRIAFLAGLVLAPTLWRLVAEPVMPRFQVGWVGLVLAGLLVGWGTRHGSGCTSGHGVCGISRLSPRSIVATLAFMATGICTVFVVRHVLA
jgi:uncharacterized membrane protein YedE/YeeE